MNRRLLLALAPLALGTAGTMAWAQQQQGPQGYLAPAAFDVLAVLPPAPTPGDARATADRAIFRQTRKLEGTPRYALATNDVKLSPTDMMRDFSCAAGIALTPQNAPATLALVTRASVDTGRQTGRAKDFYKRQRPFAYDKGNTCQPRQEVMDSYDYPSGHTTYGWTWATLLAWALPDRATPLLARGRAYGQSRAVCGVHNASAVDGGLLSASATLDAVVSDAAFQRDLAAARAELTRLRASAPPPDAAACDVEAKLVAQRVY